MIVPDINMLLYAHKPDDPSYDGASHWWRNLLEGEEEVGILWTVALGFLRMMSSPVDGLPRMSPVSASALMAAWFEHAHINILNPGDDHMRILLECLTVDGSSSNLVMDAHIAAVALEHDAEVHSRDADFARFPGLRWVNPLA